MTISDRSLVVWWAYLFEGGVPGETNLCALFWRCVLFTPIKLCLWACVGFILSLAVAGMIEIGWWRVLRNAVVFASFVGGGGAVIWWLSSARGTSTIVQSPPGRAVAYVKANYCPHVVIERRPS